MMPNCASDDEQVLLLHGSASHGGMWKPLVTALELCLAPLAPDLIGYGSGPPWREEQGVSLADEVGHLLPLIAPFPRMHLVGYSYGGAVALALASAAPRQVASLTLIEPVAFPALTSVGDTVSYETFRCWHSEFTAHLAAGAASRAMSSFIDLWSGGPVWEAMSTHRRSQLQGLAHRIEWDWRASFASVLNTKLLAELATRTLLVRGDRSPQPMIALVAALHRLMSSATLTVIPGAGHTLPLTHASDLAAVLQRRMASCAAGRGPERSDQIPGSGPPMHERP
jgi:lipase